MSSKKKMAWEFLKLLCYDETTQESLFKYSQGVSVLKNVSTSKNVTKYIQEDAPLDSSYNLEFFDDMMEQAITIKYWMAMINYIRWQIVKVRCKI